MIYDKLENIGGYLGCHKNLDTAVRYILSHDLYQLPAGKLELDGTDVFVNVMDAQAGPEEEKQFEFHRRYMDIQIDLTGTERILIGDRGNMEILSYGEDADFGSCRCRTSVSCTMGPGNFVVCMAGEPHKPGIAVFEDTALRKAVFKVKV